MAIDTIRLLTESAARLWQRLISYNSSESLPICDGYEVWMAQALTRPLIDHSEEQSIRRDYCRLCEILTEIETLVQSRARAIELVRARVAEQSGFTVV